MKIPENHERALVKFFQSGAHGKVILSEDLKVDGIYGPKTASALDEYLDLYHTEPDLMQVAWEFAALDIGKGGVGGNNKGPYIRALRAACGFPVWEDGEEVDGPWCGVFCSAQLLAAGIKIKSRGAYRLVETMANHSEGYEIKSRDMVLGRVYLACWKRTRWATHREAHVRFVRLATDDTFDFIEGNGKGDMVHLGTMTRDELNDGLIIVAGYGPR